MFEENIIKLIPFYFIPDAGRGYWCGRWHRTIPPNEPYEEYFILHHGIPILKSEETLWQK